MTIELKPATLDFLKKGVAEYEDRVSRFGEQSPYLYSAPYLCVPTLAKARLVDNLDATDIALIGVPTDVGLSSAPGARMGPNALRQCAQINVVNAVTGTRPFDLARISDVGNVAFGRTYSIDDVVSDLYSHFRRYTESGVIPVAVGGDHSITYPILKALAPSEPVGVIHFDAHHDTVPSLVGSKFHHGATFLLGVLGGHIDPARMVQIGIRDPFVDLNNFARESGMTVIDMPTFHKMGVKNVIEKARDVVGDGPVYLTFDVDGMDPVYMPGTGTPVPGGLSMHETLAVLRGLSGVDFIGADLVEVSPPLENGTLTAMNAAYIYFEILCLVAKAYDQRQ